MYIVNEESQQVEICFQTNLSSERNITIFFTTSDGTATGNTPIINIIIDLYF